jgi:hypothetical protein
MPIQPHAFCDGWGRFCSLDGGWQPLSDNQSFGMGQPMRKRTQFYQIDFSV